MPDKRVLLSLLNSTCMETHDSVVSMTEAYAQKAVIIAREFNARLDYSENSLMELEGILSQLALDLPPGGPATDELTEMCKMWGCYFGEVVRRRFGGDWSIDTYPGKQFATLTLTVAGNKLFPSMKIHRRLTRGRGRQCLGVLQNGESQAGAGAETQTKLAFSVVCASV